MQLFGGWNIGRLLSKLPIRQNTFPAKISSLMVLGCVYMLYTECLQSLFLQMSVLHCGLCTEWAQDIAHTAPAYVCSCHDILWMHACTYVLYNTAVPTLQWYVLLQVKPHATVIPVLTYVGGTDSTCTLFGGIWLCYTYISQNVRNHYVCKWSKY